MSKVVKKFQKNINLNNDGNGHNFLFEGTPKGSHQMPNAYQLWFYAEREGRGGLDRSITLIHFFCVSKLGLIAGGVTSSCGDMN